VPELRPTFHLASRERWDARDPSAPYAAPSLATEGFVHCTDGHAAMVATANKFYRDEPGEFLVLTIDLDRCGSPWRIDEPGKPYPHVYGPIAPESVQAVRPFRRGADGTFIGFE
jgi:uncharacterized protein (DUF952 family)